MGAGVGGAGAAPGRGSSQTAHCTAAVAGFCKRHVGQVQPPWFGGFEPAASQLKPCMGPDGEPEGANGVDAGAAVEDPGFGSSHTVHLSLTESGLDN